jgi:type IV secretion system protein VirB10
MIDSQFRNDGREGQGQTFKQQRSGVRRVNNLPLLIVGGVLAVFVVLVAMVAYDRAAESAKGGQAESVVADEGLAEQVLKASGDREGGLVGGGEAVLPSLPVVRVDNMDLPPPPPPAKEDPFQAQLKLMKMAALQKAINARTPVNGEAEARDRPPVRERKAGSEPSAPSQGGDDAAELLKSIGAETGGAQFRESLSRLQNGGAGGTGDESRANRSATAYAKFDRKPENDRWRLDSSVEAPRTPYELRAGFVIPAILISGVNSDLPGQILAQVSQDVYDTATGKHRLIPQGTRLVGTYDAQVAYGQRRVLVAWQRLVFPDGKAMDIGSMPGADATGSAGFKDKVNNHYLRIFGNALLMSGVIAGINSSQTNPGNDPFGNSTNSLLSQAVAQQMGRVAVEMIQKNLNISPTLEIRPGYRFNVMVVKDLTFDRPYQPFDY